MALEREVETYERLRAGLAGSEGRYAVISGAELIGIYDTYELAVQAAYAACGLVPFLVKRIEAVDSVLLITRLISPCPS